MYVEIYSKEGCPHCLMAKTVLASKNIVFHEQKLFRDFTKEQILEKFPHAQTFPIIIVDGYFIGGYTQLKTYLEEQTNSNKTLLNE